MAYFRSFIVNIKNIYCHNLKTSVSGFTNAGRNLYTRFAVPKMFSARFSSKCPCRHVTVKPPSIMVYGGILTALGIAKEKQEDEDPLINTLKLGILSFQKQDYNTAERILHLALKIAQERSDSQAVTYIYDILANVAFQKGDLKKAEILITDVMKRIISTGTPQDDNAIIELSLKLSSVFDQQKLFDKAEEGYQFCLKTQKEKIDKIDLSGEAPLTELEQDTLLLWAMSSDWYGRHLLAVGRLKVAQENFVKAYGMSETINGPLHHQTLVLMNDIGSVASLRENYVEALHYLKSAVEKGKLGNTPDLASFYCNLGTTYMKKGDYSEALNSCQEGLRIAKEAKQKDAEIECQECIEELRKLGVK